MNHERNNPVDPHSKVRVDQAAEQYLLVMDSSLHKRQK